MLKFEYLPAHFIFAFWASFVNLHLFSANDSFVEDFSVEVKDESCSSNGELLFVVTPTDTAASITFTIFLNPELTLPFKVQTETTLTNLSAGEYRVIATRELNGSVQRKQVDVTINHTYEPLDFQLVAEDVCQGEDGKIIVNTVSGMARTYQLRGPVSRDNQTENEFDGLPEGNYSVQVTNECGEKVSKSITLHKSSFNLDESRIDFDPMLPSCGEISVGHFISSTGSRIRYPIIMDFRVRHPEGGTEIVQTVVENGHPVEGFVYGTIPFTNGISYTYDVQITDACGNISRSYDHPVEKAFEVSRDLRLGAGDCGKRILSISPLHYTAPYEINFITYPEGFDPSLNEEFPGPYHSGTTLFGSQENPMPDGSYVFEVMDACGLSSGELRMDHRTATFSPGQTLYHGCGSTEGSVQLATNDYNMTLVEIVSAPEAYSHPLPHDVTENVHAHDGRRFSMNSLPEGVYEFYLENDCGSNHNVRVEIQGHKVNLNEVEVRKGCGSFDLLINHESNLNSNQGIKYGLQKYDPLTQTWGHPQSGGVYQEGDDLNDGNAAFLHHNRPNYNFTYTGQLRVVKTSRLWKNGADIQAGQPERDHCLMVLQEFEIYNSLNLSEVGFFSCSGDLFNAVMTATGTPDLNFKIISKNGDPFVVDNGDNPVFSGLEKGLYEFQIEDACSNVLNKTLNIYQHVPRIIPHDLCHGQTGELKVEGFDFLLFEWWKDDDPSRILSDRSSLSFESFDSRADAGLYWVRMTDTDPESCLNDVLQFEIPSEDRGPQAGSDRSAAICEGEVVDLFAYLEEPFDNYGAWEEVTESNSLDNYLWNTMGLPVGTYEFIYTVPGICEGEDQITLTLNLLAAPTGPVGEPIQTFCASALPTVADLVAEGENISWYLQPEGGVPLTEDDVLSDNTRYYATQTVNGCPSIERLETTVFLEEQIQNNLIGQDQALLPTDVPSLLTGSTPSGGNDVFEYQWQLSIDELSWENISGADQKDYQPGVLTNDTYYRRIVRNDCDEHISDPVALSMIRIDLAISKTSYNREIYDGENFVYEIFVENVGLFDATEVTVTDSLPLNLSYVAARHYPSSQNTHIIPTVNQNAVMWNITGLATGESVSIQLEVSPHEEGPVVNAARVSNREGDINPENNRSEDQNRILPIFIPNVIKPDFDGKNDYFVIRALEKFETVRVVIFNRWGDHVYESTDYQNDWSADGLNAGTYYYVINATGNTGREHSYKGWVQVIKN